MNRSALKPLLLDLLSDIMMDPTLACELDPSLTTQHTDAMSNGDLFIPEPPPFEIYKTKIRHGCNNDRIETDVLGIKCTVEKSRLLKEFFTQIGNPMELDTRVGSFLPTGAVHMISTEAYAKLLRDNNLFLQNVITVPIGDFQHATLDIPFSNDTSTDIDAMTLHEKILNQPWCLSLKKSTTPNKVLLVMTKGQVAAARDWVDNTLLTIYTQHILDKLDVTMLQQIVPRRLDKPVITAASHTYAEKFKQRTAMVTTAPTKQNPLNRPPRKRIVKPADITFAEQDFPRLPTTQQLPPAATIATTANDPAPTQQPPFDYQAMLDRITKDVETTLKAKFDAAIANLQQSFMNLERRVDQKLQSHMDTMKASQADKATQDDHTQRLEQVTKTLDTLVAQMHILLDSRLSPRPRNGVGHL